MVTVCIYSVIFFICGGLPVFAKGLDGVDPLSKIKVQSQRAFFCRNKENKERFCLQYKGNVFVELADSTTIKADFLEIFVQGKGLKNLQGTSDTGIEKIIFKHNVFVDRKNRKVRADFAELIVPKKLCKLDGNVLIEQVKEDGDDIHLKTECDTARICLETDKIDLCGTQSSPVDTTIKLDGKLRLFGRKFLNKDKTKDKFDGHN